MGVIFHKFKILLIDITTTLLEYIRIKKVENL